MVNFAGFRLHTLDREQKCRPKIINDVAGPSVWAVLTIAERFDPVSVMRLINLFAISRVVAMPKASST